jgi:hypothetical protein
MRSIAMIEKGLAEKRQEPMTKKEYNNDHKDFSC